MDFDEIITYVKEIDGDELEMFSKAMMNISDDEYKDFIKLDISSLKYCLVEAVKHDFITFDGNNGIPEIIYGIREDLNLNYNDIGL